MPTKYEDFTDADKRAQVNLRQVACGLRRSVEKVNEAIAANPHAVALGGSEPDYKVCAFVAIEKTLSSHQRRHMRGEGKDMEAKIKLLKEIKEVLREATLKYAIDNDDVELLEEMAKVAGFRANGAFADGTKPKDYATASGKEVYLAWYAERVGTKAKAAMGYFAESAAAGRALEAERTEEILKAMEKGHERLVSVGVTG